MKILHLVLNLAEASGVVTFVRELTSSLSVQGVTCEILTETSSLPPRIEADVVHIHGLWRPAFHRLARQARAENVPVVWSTHGMTAPWSMRHKWLKKKIAWWLYQRKDLRAAALVHATSEKEREWNAALGFQQQVVVPLGTRLPEKESNAAVDLDLQPRPKTLLFVGRVYPVKALDRLIRALGLVGSRGEGMCRLRIVGPDEAGHMAELKELCRGLGLRYEGEGASVEFVGPKYGADLDAEYENCDCLALVSHTENFGATVVDAMAHGKPVITSAATPWEEVAKPLFSTSASPAGWWVSNDPETLAKTLREFLAAPPEKLAEMGRSGRALVERKYTWAAVARQMKDAYAQIVRVSR